MKSVLEAIIEFFMRDKTMIYLGVLGFILIIVRYYITGFADFPIISTCNMFLLFAVVHRLGQISYYLKTLLKTCNAWNDFVKDQKTNCE